MNTHRQTGLAVLSAAALLAVSLSSNAAVIFSNDFSSAPTGFTANGFTAATLPLLAVDSSGATTSRYLGLFDSADFADLSLTGLTAGTVYGVSFDLFAGLTLDGNAGGVGPDKFILTPGVTVGGVFTQSGTNLVDATFSSPSGGSSPQSYSDATPTAGTSLNNATLTGADVVNVNNQYAIYYFSHGAATNPQLSFLATGPTATLRFAASGLQSENDEFFAIDNVIITAPDQTDGRVPDTGTTLFLFAAALLAMGCIRRFVIA